jgi:hypothetical protein
MPTSRINPRLLRRDDRYEIGRDIAMNATSSGATAHERFGTVSDEPTPDKSLDAAWNVLEAANDLGDHATVEACRRVIDASLNKTPASPSDLHIVTTYFR